jgi:hypothetical protein
VPGICGAFHLPVSGVSRLMFHSIPIFGYGKTTPGIYNSVYSKSRSITLTVFNKNRSIYGNRIRFRCEIDFLFR